MVICPTCKQEFPPKEMWTEVFEAEEYESGKRLGQFIMSSCPHCHVFLETKGPVTVY